MINQIEMEDIVVGRAKRYRDITVFPLHRAVTPRLDYMALDEALDRKLVEVTEVDAAGSVPDLLVKNCGKRSVLIIDGEEVVGAKQNRVVNTSILLPAESTTKIPVSCTEAGRWAEVSAQFKNQTRCCTTRHGRTRLNRFRPVI